MAVEPHVKAGPIAFIRPVSNTKLADKRLLSVDITRGLVVLFSVFTSAIPGGGYEQFRHSAWYGLTLFDLIFPSFLTLFGVSMALAYRNGVRWKNLFLRTARLVMFGLLFNMVVSWSISLQTLRITGVLMLYAVLGVSAVAIASFIKRWQILLLLGMAISASYLALLLVTSVGYPGGVPLPDFNLSRLIDPKVFGAFHIYYQGSRGYDPEGILNMYSALTNVLLGYAAGIVLYTKKMRRNLYLLFIGMGLIAAGYFCNNNFLAFNKKIWTPSYALLTAGIAIATLSVLHTLFDYNFKWPQLVKGCLWYLEAFGRNSFLVYFGKIIVLTLMGNLSLFRFGIDGSISTFLLSSVQSVTPYHPQIIYALVMVVFWSIITVVLHGKRWYVKI